MTDAAVFDIVKRKLLEVVPDLDPVEVTPERTLVDLGANSVDRMDVITMSMEEVGTALPLVSFKNAQTIGELVAVLAAPRA